MHDTGNTIAAEEAPTSFWRTPITTPQLEAVFYRALWWLLIALWLGFDFLPPAYGMQSEAPFLSALTWRFVPLGHVLTGLGLMALRWFGTAQVQRWVYLLFFLGFLCDAVFLTIVCVEVRPSIPVTLELSRGLAFLGLHLLAFSRRTALVVPVMFVAFGMACLQGQPLNPDPYKMSSPFIDGSVVLMLAIPATIGVCLYPFIKKIRWRKLKPSAPSENRQPLHPWFALLRFVLACLWLSPLVSFYWPSFQALFFVVPGHDEITLRGVHREGFLIGCALAVRAAWLKIGVYWFLTSLFLESSIARLEFYYSSSFPVFQSAADIAVYAWTLLLFWVHYWVLSERRLILLPMAITACIPFISAWEVTHLQLFHVHPLDLNALTYTRWSLVLCLWGGMACGFVVLFQAANDALQEWARAEQAKKEATSDSPASPVANPS